MMETHELLITFLSSVLTIALGVTSFFLKDLYNVIKKQDENFNKLFTRLSVMEEREKATDTIIKDLETRLRVVERK